MARLFTAICNALPIDGVPSEICYVPEGKRQIFPQSHPKGVWVNLPADQGTAIAARFESQLQELLKANVKPWIDFEHTGRFPSAGRPTGFRYEPGVGLMCAMDWSRSGKEAIEGKDVNYFSPRVDIDERGIPHALPKRGPLGGLVTEPAFRDMPAIAANQAEDTPNHPAMIQILATCGLLSANEAALEGAETLAASRVTALKANAEKIVTLEAAKASAEKERDEWKKKFDDAEAANKTEKEKRAKDKVEAAVAAGKIAPKDEDTQKYFTDRIVAGDAFAEKMLEGLPKLHPGIDKPIVTANADKGGNNATGLEAKAQAMVTAGQAKTLDEAIELVAAADPAAYSDYLKTLG